MSEFQFDPSLPSSFVEQKQRWEAEQRNPSRRIAVVSPSETPAQAQAPPGKGALGGSLGVALALALPIVGVMLLIWLVGLFKGKVSGGSFIER